MEFAELKKHLRSQKPNLCYCCYGDDEYLLSRAVSMITALASEPHAFNVADREFKTGRELTEELMQLPLTGDYRAVVARGKPDVEAIAEYFKAPNPSCILVTVAYVPHDSWNRVSAPTIPQGATGVDCNRLAVGLTVRYVEKVMAECGVRMDGGVAEALYNRCGGYMTRISCEAQKLAVCHAGGKLSVADINDEVRADAEFVVYELTDSIIKRDTVKALAIVDGMAKNNDLGAAFTLLYNRFKRMFAVAVDPNDIAALGVKPFMAEKLRNEASKFGKARLKSLVDALASADYSYKTGVISQYDALYSFVIRASAG